MTCDEFLRLNEDDETFLNATVAERSACVKHIQSCSQCHKFVFPDRKSWDEAERAIAAGEIPADVKRALRQDLTDPEALR